MNKFAKGLDRIRANPKYLFDQKHLGHIQTFDVEKGFDRYRFSVGMRESTANIMYGLAKKTNRYPSWAQWR
jgi:hypothetical protein